MKIALLASIVFLAGCFAPQTAITEPVNTVPTVVVAEVKTEKVSEPAVVEQSKPVEKNVEEKPKEVDNEPKYRYSCILVVEQGKQVQKCKKIRVRESFQGTTVPR
jgi:PBP1b-binding outer membrane lipoprotein LpoB